MNTPIRIACLLAWTALPAPQVAPAVKQDWPPPYEFIHDEEYKDVERSLAALPFSRIELERTTCYGSCPDYTVTLHRDGKAEYVGREWAPREGTFTGDVSPFDYGRLCLLVERSGFPAMPPEYFRQVTDHASTYIRVWRTDSAEPLVVRDYGDFGPLELWMLQEAIDSVGNRIEWTRVRTQRDPAEHGKQHAIRPDVGLVPDAEAAIQIALAVWRPIFGKDGMPAPTSCSAELGKLGEWTIQGPLAPGDVGGVAVAEISKDNGMVYRVSHRK